MDNNDTPVTTASENKGFIITAHLIGLINIFVLGLGTFVQFVIWMAFRKSDPFLDSHGKAILNFQLTTALGLICLTSLYTLTHAGAVFTLLGIYVWLVFGIQLVGPILGTLAVRDNRPFKYFLSIPFLR